MGNASKPKLKAIKRKDGSVHTFRVGGAFGKKKTGRPVVWMESMPQKPNLDGSGVQIKTAVAPPVKRTYLPMVDRAFSRRVIIEAMKADRRARLKKQGR